jgi:hypothetical protein
VNVSVTFNLHEDDSLERVFKQVEYKVYNQAARAAGCLCTHDESDDIVYDINGNRCGRIEVKEETS